MTDMHKIDKHTGLYLEWDGPIPVNEMRWTLLEEDATLNDLASQINDFLLTKSLGFRNKVRRGILATLPGNFNSNTRLWDLVVGYPTTALSVVEDLDYKREPEVRMEATKNEASDDGYTRHYKNNSGLIVDDVRKPGEVAEEYHPYVVTHVIRSQPFQIVVDRDIWKKGQVVYLEDNETMTIKSNPKIVGLGYAYETDIYNQFVPGTRIYAFKR